MIKKYFILVSLLICFCFLNGCEEMTLEDYKISSQSILEKKLDQLDANAYTEVQLEAINKTLQEAIEEIEGCQSHEEVDEVLRKAKLNADLGLYEIQVLDMVECDNFYQSNISNPRGFYLRSDLENVIFEIVIDQGKLKGKVGNSASYESGQEIVWVMQQSEPINRAFVDVTMKVDGKIVGYAVIEIYPNHKDGFIHRAQCIVSSIFPEIKGIQQEITAQQLEKIFVEAKKGHKYD